MGSRPTEKSIVIIAEFSIHPIESSTSVSRYVKAAINSLSKILNLKYEVTPMATVLEAPTFGPILRAVETSHQRLRSMGAKRISSILRIDDRLDKPRTMKDKIAGVKR